MKLIAGITLGHERPKLGRMIHLLGVRQLVDQHVINQLKRKLHESDVETYGTRSAAASPATACMRKPYSFILAIKFVC